MNVTYLKPKKKRTNKNLKWFGNMLKFMNEELRENSLIIRNNINGFHENTNYN